MYFPYKPLVHIYPTSSIHNIQYKYSQNFQPNEPQSPYLDPNILRLHLLYTSEQRGQKWSFMTTKNRSWNFWHNRNSASQPMVVSAYPNNVWHLTQSIAPIVMCYGLAEAVHHGFKSFLNEHLFFLNMTSESQKTLPSAVVIHFWAW